MTIGKSFLRVFMFTVVMNLVPACVEKEDTVDDFKEYNEKFPQSNELEIFVKKWHRDHFIGAKGAKIAYAAVGLNKHPRANVIFIPGYTETYLLNAETIKTLSDANYNVYVLDHRGMGLSDSVGSNPKISHLESFDHFVEDVNTFATLVKEKFIKDSKIPQYMFAHSMGGLVALHYLQQHQDNYQKVFFSTPLFSVFLRGVPEFIVRSAARYMTYFGFGNELIIGHNRRTVADIPPTISSVSSSKARLTKYTQLLTNRPKLFLWGPSYSWLNEVLKATDAIKEIAATIKTKTLILQADRDYYVSNQGHKAFCESAFHCRIEKIEGAKHEIFKEVNIFRHKAERTLLNFFAER